MSEPKFEAAGVIFTAEDDGVHISGFTRADQIEICNSAFHNKGGKGVTFHVAGYGSTITYGGMVTVTYDKADRRKHLEYPSPDGPQRRSGDVYAASILDPNLKGSK